MATGNLEKHSSRVGHMGRENFVGPIRCSRCTGLMVVEQGFDSMLGSSEADMLLRRCVQCGEIIDPVILQNRRLRPGRDLERTQK